MEPWQQIDDATTEEARALLARCCGASRWIERMIARRPFGDRGTLLTAAREEWFALGPSDWLEAFAHHPKIGDRDALHRGFAATRQLSAREQSGVDSSSEEVLSALEVANRSYEKKFGFIFIVCATGKSAAEMLGILEQRMGNDLDTEIRIAAEEQARITEIRLMGIG